jgi:hypothetical protein
LGAARSCAAIRRANHLIDLCSILPLNGRIRSTNRLRTNSDLMSDLKLIRRWGLLKEKFSFRFSEKYGCLCASCFRSEGALRPIVTNVGSGMRWTRRRARRAWLAADGEIVWSWRPDAGVKFCETFRRATVAKKPGTPGRARYKRKPSRRECRLLRLDLWSLPPAYFVAAGHGCGLHPAFPAPSDFRGT